MSRPIVVTACMPASSESWSPHRRPPQWHLRAAGGAVHSISSGHLFAVRKSDRDLSQRRFDDGDILLDTATSYTDSGNHLTLPGERHAATHCTKSPRRDHAERIER